MSSLPNPTTDTPTSQRPFSTESESIPSSALGLLSGLIRDDLDRLRRRTRRDGHSAGVKAAGCALDLFADALEREAERRDWVRDHERGDRR